MNFTIFFQRIKADFKSLLSCQFHEIFKKLNARRSDQEYDVLIERFGLAEVRIKFGAGIGLVELSGVVRVVEPLHFHARSADSSEDRLFGCGSLVRNEPKLSFPLPKSEEL